MYFLKIRNVFLLAHLPLTCFVVLEIDPKTLCMVGKCLPLSMSTDYIFAFIMNKTWEKQSTDKHLTCLFTIKSVK